MTKQEYKQRIKAIKENEKNEIAFLKKKFKLEQEKVEDNFKKFTRKVGE